MQRLVCSKDLILNELKKLEDNVEAMFGQKVDYSQQLGALQKIVIIKFKDDSDKDDTATTQCFIHLDNEIGKVKKRKQAQKSVKKTPQLIMRNLARSKKETKGRMLFQVKMKQTWKTHRKLKIMQMMIAISLKKAWRGKSRRKNS